MVSGETVLMNQFFFNLPPFDWIFVPVKMLKIGSSTWATHLLRMKNIPIYKRTPIHGIARDTFPPLLGRQKQKFLKHAESFIVARDPFERLLSSYKVCKFWYIKPSGDKICFAGQVECDHSSYPGDMGQLWSGSESYQVTIQGWDQTRQCANLQRICQIFGKMN